MKFLKLRDSAAKSEGSPGRKLPEFEQELVPQAPSGNALMHFLGEFPSKYESSDSIPRLHSKAQGSQATRRSRGWLRTLGSLPQKTRTLKAFHKNSRDAKTIV